MIVDIYTPKVAQEYLQILNLNEIYEGYWIDSESMKIMQGSVIIEEDGNHDYHNNVDKSKPDLYIIRPQGAVKQRLRSWWTLSLQEVKKHQAVLIEVKGKTLRDELHRLASIAGVVETIEY